MDIVNEEKIDGSVNKLQEHCIDPDDVCPKSESGKHEPDWDNVITSYDGELYIDVNCKLCGRSGCIGSSKTLAENITW